MTNEKQIQEWLESGTITQEQAQKMLADVDQKSKEERSNKFIVAISTIGAILLVLLVLFVSDCDKPNNNPINKKMDDTENSQKIEKIFNNCGNVENFKEEEWFIAFLNKILNQDDLDTEYANFKYENRKLSLKEEKDKMAKTQKQQLEENPNQMTLYISDMEIKEAENKVEQLSSKEIIQEFGKIKIDNIRELCFSKSKNFVIAITGGEYCTTGNVFRYDILTNEIKRAQFKSSRESCDVTFSNFEKVNGDIMQLIGKFGDAGIAKTDFFDYNFIDNTIFRKKSCISSVNNPEEKCTNTE